ncbi:hypothetical protein P3X46_012842 [Hevea brasiliensis]|uniref:Peptidase A1 domain-containing protein n=1 Tax=Hevea brasiliensis TaxID=3981 RepID=A0ABQ9MBH8_HEVBR|nr:aspartic proteinase-like protein 1 isoform X1 [Hevea brasiliensis]KAJ9177647.1 hypothetical protein P3X46_012842 [Hevea brasiliensis]
MAARSLLILVMASLLVGESLEITFSSKLIHRFSDEMKTLRVSKYGSLSMRNLWPEKKSVEYYQKLVSSDFQRQKMKLGPHYNFLFPSEGSKTMSLGNDFGWLHYTWIDIGTPHVSFLVALDAGSDLLWVPCDCVQCAPLSASYYNSLDRDLNEYSPSHSSTSKHLSCSHRLCESGPNCKSPKQPCPYAIDYYTENTSSSGLLLEDILHLASDGDNALNASVQAAVVIGCGMKQSGGYLDGVAPDGLMGLGLSEISVPSFLAKAGLIRNSFSMCFDEDDSGRIFFGDQGPTTQQSTPFLTLNGNYTTYIVGVEACCVGSSCLKQTSFRALVDTGTSFTFLPEDVYERVTEEFDRQVNVTISSFDGYHWKYCYKSSSKDSPKVPSVKLIFPLNNSFVIHNPVFMIYGMQGVAGFCLAIQPTDEDIGTIGQNFMTGYRVVFDRENLKLGWSRSDCEGRSDGKRMPLTSPSGAPANPLPTNEQQSTPGGHAVSPAVAGRAPSKPSAASARLLTSQFCLLKSLLVVVVLHVLV